MTNITMQCARLRAQMSRHLVAASMIVGAATMSACASGGVGTRAAQYGSSPSAVVIENNSWDRVTVYISRGDQLWRLGEASGTTAADSARFGTYPGAYRTGVTKGQPGIIPGNTAVTTPGTNLGTVATQASLTPTTTFTGEIWFNTTTPGDQFDGELASLAAIANWMFWARYRRP